MTPNRIMRAAAVRRALLLGLAVGACAVALVACGGGGGDTSSSVSDKAADAEVLNEILARQTAAVAAYDHSLHGLGGHALDPRPRLPRPGTGTRRRDPQVAAGARRGGGTRRRKRSKRRGLKSEAEYLEFLYELESATIEAELSAIARLTSPTPRSMLATTVANQAQHLVLLRRALGAKSVESVPRAFEDGTTPAP